jgi:hypothetical protein
MKRVFILLSIFQLYATISSGQLSYTLTNQVLDEKMIEWAGKFYHEYHKETLETDDLYSLGEGDYKAVGRWKYTNRLTPFGSTYEAKFTAWIKIRGSGRVTIKKICITEHVGQWDEKECKDFKD